MLSQHGAQNMHAPTVTACVSQHYITCSAQVVVGAAVVGAVYAGVAYFQKDKDVADSIDRFGSNVKSDAKGMMLFATAASAKLLEQVFCQS